MNDNGGPQGPPFLFVILSCANKSPRGSAQVEELLMPPTMTMPEWVVYVQALGPSVAGVATVVVAATVALVAWRQWVVARDKLALDLFDKRYQLFIDTSTAIDRRSAGEVENWDNLTFDLSNRTGYLFGKRAAVAVKSILDAVHSGEPVQKSEGDIAVWASILTKEMAMPTRFKKQWEKIPKR